MQDNKESKKEGVTSTPDQFVVKEDRDILRSYIRCRSHIPSNPVEAYVVKKKCIEFGKELLPSFIDLTEEDEEQIKKNKIEQENIDELYKKACRVLKTEIPNKRQIKYKYLDKGNRVYELKAGDADNCEVVKDDLETVMNNFTNQQHEQHMGALEEVDNKIFHVLVQKDIVKKQKPTIDDILDKRIKERYEKGDS